MPTQVLRPNATVQAGSWTLTGTTVHGALSDDDDATFLDNTTAIKETNGSLVDLGDLSIPSGAKIRALRFRARVRTDEPSPGQVAAHLRWSVSSVGGPQESLLAETEDPSPHVVEGAWRVDNPSGEEWSVADVDSLRARVWKDHARHVGVYELYLDVDYNEPPSAVVTAPSGAITNTTPLVEWTYSDAEGDSQDAAQVRIYQQPAGGWTTAEFGGGALLYDSGVLGPVLSHLVEGADLSAATEFRAYVRVRQEWPSSDHWSPWSFSAFTINALRPGVPTIAVTPQDDQGRMSVQVDETAGDAATEWMDVDYSDDGTTWHPLRFGQDLVPPSATVLDREAPPNEERLYRARSLRDDSGAIATAWSASVGATFTLSAGRWITDPVNPATLHRLVKVSSHSGTKPRRDATFRAIGRKTAVVVSDTPGGSDDSLTLVAVGSAEWTLTEDLMDSTNVLLLRGPRDHRYVVIQAASWEQAGPDQAGPTATPGIRRASLQTVEVSMPSVDE